MQHTVVCFGSKIAKDKKCTNGYMYVPNKAPNSICLKQKEEPNIFLAYI